MQESSVIKSSSEGLSSSRLTTLVFVTLAVGVVSGLAGMSLAMLLHFIQHLAYGYTHTLLNPETFLEGVSSSTPSRRIFVLTLCGLIAAFGWWAIYRYGRPLVSIANAVKADKPQMPIAKTTLNALLQIITVALGSPLGREVAPREIGSVFACWISEKTRLSSKEAKIMVACGAGAGLAAVYNVPFGGTVFILETLLFTLNWSALIPALCTCAIATAVSWIGLGNEPEYQLPDFVMNYSLVFWSVLASPIFGIGAYYFSKITSEARSKAPRDGRVLPLALINFIIIGLLAVYFPALLGNGKGPIELGFSDQLAFGLATSLLILRVLIVWSSLRAGAQGGLLTPSLANGVLLAIILGSLWDMVWPGPHIGSYSVVGATAFLAASQRMPLTAIVLTAEFTNIDFNFLLPILIGVTGSVSTFTLLKK
ncbi:H(+)/Cl(-) exchange transporter ClcA [Legionella massiliensis]|uniref:H(+)/Cl(-) exchange transporter ClcA n=1 Tax=Legionella massiliensis TaxID=1034943 RepID=A0A078L0P6_9GAMM|nr:chloride channel protein [Legionella massiliensis]CDZ77583.1 H(+)/Cl(-) exchange transporter ClcA [Legionella massiliensis]CEE13321.1 H(+)/Cl(-) exchange transporter ClcA [Legionella massiliensis]